MPVLLNQPWVISESFLDHVSDFLYPRIARHMFHPSKGLESNKTTPLNYHLFIWFMLFPCFCVCVFRTPSKPLPKHQNLFEQGSLYYQPKQCTTKGKSLKLYQRFALLDSPPTVGSFNDPRKKKKKTTHPSKTPDQFESTKHPWNLHPKPTHNVNVLMCFCHLKNVKQHAPLEVIISSQEVPTFLQNEEGNVTCRLQW